MQQAPGEPSAVDDYIAGFPPEVQELLQAVRTTIRVAAPAAAEGISYQIPTFYLAGQALIYFAGFKKHIGVYPAPRAHPDLAEELAGYAGGKGTVQFPLGRPIPHDLIARMVGVRMREILARTESRRHAPGTGGGDGPRVAGGAKADGESGPTS